MTTPYSDICIKGTPFSPQEKKALALLEKYPMLRWSSATAECNQTVHCQTAARLLRRGLVMPVRKGNNWIYGVRLVRS